MTSLASSTPPVDLTARPDWAPHRTRHQFSHGWTVDTWEEPSLPGHTTLDGSLVTRHANTLRLAVIDSAANPHGPNPEKDALTAVHTIRGWLAAEPGPWAAIKAANNALNDPHLRPRQRNPFAACALLDLNMVTGTIHAAQYADCEVWVRQGTHWESLFTGDMFTPPARAVHDHAETVHVRGSDDWWTWQEETIDDPALWNNPPIGWATHLRPDTVTLNTAVDEIIVTTDGACLTAERCTNLTGWLNHDIQQAPAGWPHPSPHGDLTVLHAYRNPAT